MATTAATTLTDASSPEAGARGDVDIDIDIENQAVTNKNVGIFVSGGGGDDDDSATSVFSFDSCDREATGVVPVRVRGVARKLRRPAPRNPNDADGGGGAGGGDDDVPFSSAMGAAVEYDNDGINVCPCRCLFFTLKETMCLVISALGCGMFCSGIIALCMYLAGFWYFDPDA